MISTGRYSGDAIDVRQKIRPDSQEEEKLDFAICDKHVGKRGKSHGAVTFPIDMFLIYLFPLITSHLPVSKLPLFYS